jgi:hypothetical protein
MFSKKLVGSIGASMSSTENAANLRQKQLDEVLLSVDKLNAVAESVRKGGLSHGDAFAALQTAVLDFVDAQDGVGCDENGESTGLLGDSDILRAACRFLLRHKKSPEMSHLLLDFAYERAQESLNTATADEAELVKAELLQLARQGAPRPTGRLGEALTRFTTPPKK